MVTTQIYDPARNKLRSAGRPVRGLVTILTELFQSLHDETGRLIRELLSNLLGTVTIITSELENKH